MEITFRCWQCHRHWGNAPVLGYAGRDPGTFGGWGVLVARRVRRPGKPGGNDGGVPAPRTFAEPAMGAAGKRTVLIPLQPVTPTAQLRCSRCPHKPREARETLVKLATEALERGERVVYV